MPVSVRPLAPAVGADVDGVDLREPMSEDAFVDILESWHRYGVLRFRDQSIESEHLKAFSARFGRLQIHLHKEFLEPGHPEILLISNRKVDGRCVGLAESGRRWHSDLQYAEVPCIASVLFGEQVPTVGGDTLFAGMCAAYDALPDDVKMRIEGLMAIQSYAKATRNAIKEARDKKVPEVVHPVVKVHPATGRRAIYVSEGMTASIVGVPADESDALIDYLIKHSTEPRFVWRQQWRPGDVIIWDNRAVVHKATEYDVSQTRHLKRTTVMPTLEGV